MSGIQPGRANGRRVGSARLWTTVAAGAVVATLAGAAVANAQTADAPKAADARPAEPATAVLAPISVEAAAGPPPTASIGTTPPAYAGGQVSRGGRLGALGNRDMMDVPFQVTGYTAELIRNQQAETIADVLANDPTVRTTNTFGNFGEQFVIRGFPLTGEDIAINGLYGIAPRQIIATEFYERVELLRGANAFLNGIAPSGGGIGGSINLVPKRAADAPLTRFTGSWAQDSRFGAAADIGRRFGADNQFGARVNAAYRDGETAIEDETRALTLLGLGLDWRGEDARVTLDVGYQRQRVDNGRPVVNLTGTGVPDVPDADAGYAQDWSFSKMRDTFAQLSGEYDFAPNVTGHASFGIRDMREDGDYANPTVDKDGIGTIGRLGVPREDLALSGQAGVRGEAVTGPVLHRFDVGTAVMRTTNRNAFSYAFGQPFDLNDPAKLPRPGTDLAAGDFSDLPKVSRVDLHSVYVSDTLGFLDDRVMLTLGLRQQWLEAQNYDRTSGDVTETFDQSELSPVVGLVVRPTRQISLYANRIEGLAQGPTAPGSADNSGQMFDPYVSTQYEIGGKLDLGRLSLSLAAFQTEQPVGVVDENNIFDVNGKTRVRGVEFTAFGEPLDGLRLIGGIVVTDAVLKKTAAIDTDGNGTLDGDHDGNDAVGVPDYQLNAGVEWDLPFLPEMTIGARVLHTAGQYADVANTQKIDSWTRLDIGARYRLEVDQRPVMIRANIENVTNEAYWASANGGYLTQGRPLTAKLSVGVDF